MTTHTFELDTSVPVLLVKVGSYPLHIGGLGLLRSLGRLGVPVYAVTEDHLTPAAVSRYLTGHVVWRAMGGWRASRMRPADALRSVS